MTDAGIPGVTMDAFFRRVLPRQGFKIAAALMPASKPDVNGVWQPIPGAVTFAHRAFDNEVDLADYLSDRDGKTQERWYSCDPATGARTYEDKALLPDTWFAQGGFVAAKTPDLKRPGKLEHGRRGTNVGWMRSFYGDLDVGSGPAKYADQRAALTALIEWCGRTGTPIPPVITSSGNGIHCWWPQPYDIPVADWQAVADRLKAKMLDTGLLIDPSVTADPTRLLRAPGTRNHKDPANPKPVRLLRWA
jgi:hypothetical protein